jgi:hypothetical protein
MHGLIVELALVGQIRIQHLAYRRLAICTAASNRASVSAAMLRREEGLQLPGNLRCILGTLASPKRVCSRKHCVLLPLRSNPSKRMNAPRPLPPLQAVVGAAVFVFHSCDGTDLSLSLAGVLIEFFSRAALALATDAVISSKMPAQIDLK